MKCTLSLSLATVCNEFFIFFHVYIESFNTRIRSSLHIGYTIRLMGRVRTAAGGEEQLLHLLMFSRVSRCAGGCSHHVHGTVCLWGLCGCTSTVSWLSTVTAGTTRGGGWSARHQQPDANMKTLTAAQSHAHVHTQYRAHSHNYSGREDNTTVERSLNTTQTCSSSGTGNIP